MIEIEIENGKVRIPETSDYGCRMSNSPDRGPLEALKLAWRHFRS